MHALIERLLWGISITVTQMYWIANFAAIAFNVGSAGLLFTSSEL